MALWAAVSAIAKGLGDSAFGALEKRRNQQRIKRVAEMERDIARLKQTLKLRKEALKDREKTPGDADIDDIFSTF